MNWDSQQLGVSYYGRRNGFAYNITVDGRGYVSWLVNGDNHHAGGSAQNLADAKVHCDAASLLLECVALLSGEALDGGRGEQVIERLEPFLAEARALQSSKGGAA